MKTHHVGKIRGFVFIGAGGASLHLLEKIRRARRKGYGEGFPGWRTVVEMPESGGRQTLCETVW